jgi:hypothetical protein
MLALNKKDWIELQDSQICTRLLGPIALRMLRRILAALASDSTWIMFLDYIARLSETSVKKMHVPIK